MGWYIYVLDQIWAFCDAILYLSLWCLIVSSGCLLAKSTGTFEVVCLIQYLLEFPTSTSCSGVNRLQVSHAVLRRDDAPGATEAYLVLIFKDSKLVAIHTEQAAHPNDLAIAHQRPGAFANPVVSAPFYYMFLLHDNAPKGEEQEHGQTQEFRVASAPCAHASREVVKGRLLDLIERKGLREEAKRTAQHDIPAFGLAFEPMSPQRLDPNQNTALVDIATTFTSVYKRPGTFQYLPSPPKKAGSNG
ncbi:hypothetical protein MVEN_02389900 [Mycena venus]|uniref:Uncharacterized protein n=1 Tax=Mycena venus TaxID=2733690 RepID=A0A8H6X241_9AGAR|nr:hypothetical protein MVEN_02389900 [Mycena venus]